MNDCIRKIINGVNLEEIIQYVKNNLYEKGPIDYVDLKIISYISYFQSDFFKKYENEIIQLMGLFYKSTKVDSFESQIFEDYKNSIFDTFGKNFTPVQCDIYSNSIINNCFSFSSGTSTGKSYVFNEIIKQSVNDIVIIVPSRALINEYLIKLSDSFPEKHINILPFVDFVNLKNASRSIFVLTPERAKELFKYKDRIRLDYILFDEAQLSDENNSRALIFDSIVRRVNKLFPDTKILFAQPFVENPEAQLLKNNLNNNMTLSTSYNEKNVGQMYISYKDGDFYCFGLNKEIMGYKMLKIEDPLEKIIKSNGTALIYTHKKKIYNGDVFVQFKKYIDLCEEISDKYALKLIEDFKSVIGGNDDKSKASYSKVLEYMKRGIILHHGSLPLKARIIIEEFTKKNFCKICFSTSTLVQGINMPFDIVWLDSFEKSKPLSVKNVIGRAGRSTNISKFDYGIIVVKDNNKSDFREIMTSKYYLKSESLLDSSKSLNNDLEEYREAINKGEVDDEYNLTIKEVSRLSCDNSMDICKNILDIMFVEDKILNPNQFGELSDANRKCLYENFQNIYKIYLNGRDLSVGEKGVISTAIRILIWEIQGKTFRQIVGYRYAYIRKNNEIRKLLNQIKELKDTNEVEFLKNKLYSIDARFTTKCNDIPNKDLPIIRLFNCRAYEVDYDLVVYDTYDYVDKIIGFRLKDVYYTLFNKYYLAFNDVRAQKMALYIKYGTIDEKEIYMLRYGYSFETIEWLKDYIDVINDFEITFKNNVFDLPEDCLSEIGRYL